MKSGSPAILLALLVSVLLPPARAQQPPPAVRPLPQGRTLPGGDAMREKETVTFLGVETSPVGPVLTKQLNLQRDIGLVVNVVVPDSPASGVIELHDILIKLDDQLLIEPRQFGVLVRARKPGDDVSLTFIRGGKEQTVRVKLGKREVPRMAGWFGAPEGRPAAFFDHRLPADLPAGNELKAGSRRDALRPMDRPEADRLLQNLQRARGHEQVRIMIERKDAPDARTTVMNLGKSNILYTDDHGTLEMKVEEGKKELTVRDVMGKVVFSGPINTEDERNAVPAGVLGRLGNVGNADFFIYKTDDDFEVLRDPGRPAAETISWPAASRRLPPAGLRALRTM
ncbi:MAG: hypothetical protein A3G75_14490 [Verrucomicrobia bacterium RIFCSPLOWO2_12_FULL_64_8]|nr:MAG: hypothetical protein A3G75_14490 [Verrucomicrobia bacterium RIFCSPLOWO2_12_FULL_64_8]